MVIFESSTTIRSTTSWPVASFSTGIYSKLTASWTYVFFGLLVAISQLMGYYLRYHVMRPTDFRPIRGRREGLFLRVICDKEV